MTPVSPWRRLRDLPLEVDQLAVRRLELRIGRGFVRRTVEVSLEGGGLVGRGEDSGWRAEAHGALLGAAGPWRPGASTLGEFADHLGTHAAGEGAFGGTRPDTDEERARRWALESAALDLALRQAGLGLGEALGLRPRPLRFVASLAPRGADEVRERLALAPGLGLKLDARAGWGDELVRELAGTGAVEVVDFKGRAEGAAVLERVLEHLPRVLVEDPPTDPRSVSLLVRAGVRVALDSGLLRPVDLERAPVPLAAVNLKPARVGSLRAHLELVEACTAAGLMCYGGGRFELGVGRRQLQLLASLLHPGGPNDLGPVEHHAPSHGPLPTGPLRLTPVEAGLDVS